MKIEHVDQEVLVTFTIHRGRTFLPRVRLRHPPREPGADIEDVPPDALDWAEALFPLALSPILYLCLSVIDAHLWFQAYLWLCLGAMAIGAARRKLVLELGPRARYEKHNLHLGAGGTRLDGQPCEVWLAGERLVTGDGKLYVLACDPGPLRELRQLLDTTAEATRDRYASGQGIPQALKALLER